MKRNTMLTKFKAWADQPAGTPQDPLGNGRIMMLMESTKGFHIVNADDVEEAERLLKARFPDAKKIKNVPYIW